VVSLNVGMPRELGEEGHRDVLKRPWVTGIFKTPVGQPVWLGHVNLDGDGQGDHKVHGGPDRAVNVYPAEHYPFWRQELGQPDLAYAAFGENFTTTGQLESSVCIGDIYDVGDAVVQVTQPRLPCWKLARRFQLKDMAVRLRVTGRVGWHLRTLTEGKVAAGQPLLLVERPQPEWPIERAFEVVVNVRRDRDSARQLLRCPSLSAYLQRALADPDSVPDRVEVETRSTALGSGTPERVDWTRTSHQA
jgi:MOSC domain-containing protein YiiM